MSDSPPKTLLEIAAEFKAALEKQDAAAMKRIIQAYRQVYRRIMDEANNLMNVLELENPTRGQLAKMRRFTDLLKQVDDQLRDFQGIARIELEQAANIGVQLGELHARQLMAYAITGDLSRANAGAFNQLPREAIKQLLGFLQPESPLYKRLAELAPYVTDEVKQAILEGVGLGRNPKTIAADITNRLGLGLTDAMRNVRTAQLWAYREANRASYAAHDNLVQGWQWVATMDGTTCGACLSLHGTRYLIRDPLMGHYNCVLPGNLVSMPSRLVGGIKSFYVGRAVEILLDSGRRLTVTPNHPILTPDGWLAADSLSVDDYVLRTSAGIERELVAVHPNHNHGDVLIEDAFSSLVESSEMISASVKTTAADFHGDGACIQENVQIVRPKSHLGGGRIATISQFGSNDRFGVSDLRLILTRYRSCMKFFEAWFSTLARNMSAAKLIISLGGRHSLPLQGFSFGWCTQDASTRESAVYYGAADASGLSKFILRFASHITRDKIVEIRNFDFSGHVYDLQDEVYELYTVNGIITHNCRCTMVPVLVGLEPPVPEGAGKAWFDAQPKSVQADILGKTKLEAYQSGKFKFEDLARLTKNDVYGEMFTETPLKDLVSGAAKMPPPIPQAPPPPPPPTSVLPPMPNVPVFKTTKQAADYLTQKGYFQAVDFGKLDLPIVQDMTRSAVYHMENYPELKKQLEFFGSAQARNKQIKEIFRAQTEDWVRRIYGGYPEKRIQQIINSALNKHVEKIPGRAYAISYSNKLNKLKGVVINEKFGKYTEMITLLERDVRLGWHPPGTATVKAVMDHELGHQMDSLLKISDKVNYSSIIGDPRVKSIVDDALKTGVETSLSGYAKTSTAEFVAEAWAEYLNNPSPREVAKKIGDTIVKIYKERFP